MCVCVCFLTSTIILESKHLAPPFPDAKNGGLEECVSIAKVGTGAGVVEPGFELGWVAIQMCPLLKFYMGF